VTSTALACSGLIKTYGEVRALDGVTVDVTAPATGLLGANGAGKSTLMKLALGLLQPDSGTVKVPGAGQRARARADPLPRRLHARARLLPTDMSAQDLCIHLARLRGLPRRDALRRASEVLFAVGPRIVLAKYVAAATVVWVACLPATLACLALGTATRLELGAITWSLLAASVLAAAAYVALFTLLSLLLSRAVLVGLAYLVLWEGLLAGTAPAFRNSSVGAYANRIAGAPWVDAPFAMADTSVVVAVGTLALVTCLAVGAAALRLPRTHL